MINHKERNKYDHKQYFKVKIRYINMNRLIQSSGKKQQQRMKEAQNILNDQAII